MIKKITACLLLFCLLVFSFTGCFGKTKTGKAFSMPITEEPRSLDPQIARSTSERRIVSNCFEGLVRVDVQGAIQPGVAERYTVSPDGCTYTFYLRPDAHWALLRAQKITLGETYGEDTFKDKFDKTVYAEDFVFALQRAVDPQTGSADAFLFSSVLNAGDIMQGALPKEALGVRAIDAFTVEIQLAHPDENLLYALTAPGAMPCDPEFFALTEGRYGLEVGYLLSNGPLHVSKWMEKTSVKLIRNEDFSGGYTVGPGSVTFFYTEDLNVIPEKLEAGNFDAAFLTQAQYKGLEMPKHLQAQAIENTTYSFVFNTRNPMLANANLRKALALSYDAQKEELLGESVQKASGVVPPYCTVGTSSYRAQQAGNLLSADFNRASACFDEALLELGKNAAELEVLCAEAQEPYVRAVVGAWQKALGVKFVAEVKAVPMESLLLAVQERNYTIAFYPLRADNAWVPAYLETFGENGLFQTGDTAYAQMLQTVHAQAGSFTATLQACAQAETYLLQEAYVLPVYTASDYFITADDTKDIYFYASKDYVYFQTATKK